MTRYCYLNGEIIEERKAVVSVRDIGILRGYGVFDFLRTYNGKPFLFNEHFERLEQSAQVLHLKLPLSKKELQEVVSKLILKNKFAESTIRIVLTGGKAEDGMHYHVSTPTFFILISELQELPPSVCTQGVHLSTYERLREMPHIKSLNYLTAAKLHNPLRGTRPIEILYTWQGRVLEATTSNFFIFRRTTLITPKKDVLRGVTRNLVLKLARRKFKIKERDIAVRELRRADEAFITATNKEIVPVVTVNGRKIGNGKAGEHTKQLLSLFYRYVSRVHA